MPQDKQVYSELDKSRWLHVPNLVRLRHRYRGVRESSKVNQEINQIIYDLNSIDTKLSSALDRLETIETEQYSGKSDFEDVDYYFDGTDVYPEIYRHEGLTVLTERLSSIDRALRGLENND